MQQSNNETYTTKKWQKQVKLLFLYQKFYTRKKEVLNTIFIINGNKKMINNSVEKISKTLKYSYLE